MLDELDQIFEYIAPPLVCDNSSGEIAQHMRTYSLNCVAVVGLVQEEIDDAIAALDIKQTNEHKASDERDAKVEKGKGKGEKDEIGMND